MLFNIYLVSSKEEIAHASQSNGRSDALGRGVVASGLWGGASLLGLPHPPRVPPTHTASRSRLTRTAGLWHPRLIISMRSD